MTDMLDFVLNFAITYALLGVGLAVWFVFLAVVQLDRFDWARMDKLEAAAFLLLSALAWPIVVFKVPKSLTSIRALAPVDYRSAAYMREVDRLSKNPPHCSSSIRVCQYENGVKVAELFFSPQNVISAIGNSKKRLWGPQPDDDKFVEWAKRAVIADPIPVDVPWVWSGTSLLADEMIRAGFGSVRCLECGKEYSATEMKPDSGTAASGWIRNRQLCPEGHFALDYDFIKPFCNHKKQSFAGTGNEVMAEPISDIPSFLKKS